VCLTGENALVFVRFFRQAGGSLEVHVKRLLAETADRAAQYLARIGQRRVTPLPTDMARLEALGGPLPQSPPDPAEVLALLDDIGSPATVATTGGRYFGFVIGGSLPAALAANWMAGAWDQNAAMYVMSPVTVKIEEIVMAWMVDMLGLPSLPWRQLGPHC
jgi:glutamate/tyrosine decarboxylase-like PLP-dependent enzyme